MIPAARGGDLLVCTECGHTQWEFTLLLRPTCNECGERDLNVSIL